MLDKITLNFLVIGAQKAGTTTLHNLLSKEDRISIPLIKETHFFSNDKHYKKGMSWYLQQFPPAEDGAIFGEVDPEYLYFSEAAERIALLEKPPKIIVILRDPVKRAYSHYKMSVRRNTETLNFVEAIDQEKARSCNENKLFFSINYSYIARSLYAEQIERFMKICPDSDYLFIKFDDFIASDKRLQTYSEICEFIGIKSKLAEDDLAIKSNISKDAKYSFLNKILWDKRKYRSLRKLLRIIMPSSAFRKKLFFFLYDRNKKSADNKVAETFPEIPENVCNMVNDDILKVMSITGLDLTDWVR